MAETSSIHIDQRYIEGLLQNDAIVIDTIYKNFSPGIKRWIINNSGSEADAGDIFQETLITIFHQAKEKKLQLSCPFEAYFMVIAKRMWFKELKKRGRQEVTIDIDEAYNIGTDSFKEIEEVVAMQEKEKMVMGFFATLGERCREIISLTQKKEFSQEEIATKLGLTYAYLRKKKSECMATLIKKVQASGFQM